MKSELEINTNPGRRDIFLKNNEFLLHKKKKLQFDKNQKIEQ